MNEIRRFPEQKDLPEPTDEELLTMLANSKLRRSMKADLAKYLGHRNGWVRRQLSRIYWYIDDVQNMPKGTRQEIRNYKNRLQLIDMFWKSLKDDWPRIRDNIDIIF